jgi:hypothetical protein
MELGMDFIAFWQNFIFEKAGVESPEKIKNAQ